MAPIPRPFDPVAFDRLDEFTKLNVLGLLGQTLYEARRGNDERALLYLGTAIIAFKSKKISWAFQGALTADRLVGKLAGDRPLKVLFDDLNR